MDKIEDAVRSQRHHYNPQRRPEPERGYCNESTCDHRLEHKRTRRCSHDGKQRVVRRDHNRHGRIERAITIQPGDPGQQSCRDCEKRSDQ